MGKKAVEIVDLDVKKLIEILNQALSEEWLAYYQYLSLIHISEPTRR